MEKHLFNSRLVAATTVLYNSDEQVLININTYVDQVDITYVIDNSEKQNKELVHLIEQKSNIYYYWMKGNSGIAAALNKAASFASQAGYRYLLMMDDDSQLLEGTVDNMLLYIKQHNSFDSVGTVTAQSDPNSRGDTAQSVWYTITSGSLLNLSAYHICGPFMEALFIDGVDHEYCYRLKKLGYEVLILNYILMPHRMGTPEQVRIFSKSVYRWSSHSPLRSYYMVRNFLHILFLYRRILPVRIKFDVCYGVFKACLLDLILGENKFLRFKYIIRAISDFRNNKLGKLTQALH